MTLIAALLTLDSDYMDHTIHWLALFDHLSIHLLTRNLTFSLCLALNSVVPEYHSCSHRPNVLKKRKNRFKLIELANQFINMIKTHLRKTIVLFTFWASPFVQIVVRNSCVFITKPTIYHSRKSSPEKFSKTLFIWINKRLHDFTKIQYEIMLSAKEIQFWRLSLRILPDFEINIYWGYNEQKTNRNCGYDVTQLFNRIFHSYNFSEISLFYWISTFYSMRTIKCTSFSFPTPVKHTTWNLTRFASTNNFTDTPYVWVCVLVLYEWFEDSLYVLVSLQN